MDLITRDLKYIWHPCAQFKEHEIFPLLPIKSAIGSHFILENGQRVIDGISSWWCKNLGHRHPKLIEALIRQSEKYEHVIPTHISQEPLIALSEKLCAFHPPLNKVFYASDGSTAVEIALKMSLHARYLQGETKRNQFMSLQNGYHGETVFCLSVTDLELYRSPYQPYFPKFDTILPPYITNINDPLCQDASSHWSSAEEILEHKKEHLSAIILEPIIQGAGGMKMYSPDFLKRLRQYTKQHQIHLIFDEIMTGMGRLGHPLISMELGIVPDFVCLSKGLTGGVLPMSAVLIHQEIHELFFRNKKYQNLPQSPFLHSNTFSGNALAAAVALQCLETLEQENIYQQVQINSKMLFEYFQEVALKSQRLKNVRGIGYITAAEFILDKGEDQKRIGLPFAREAAKLGAFLRPLGNTLYWLPPLNTSENTLKELRDITLEAIQQYFYDK